MPGYKVHDAVGNPSKMKNLTYRKGLNAPDYFKLIQTEEQFDKYFEECKKDEIPTYKEFLELKKAGFHFAKNSRNANIKKFLELEFVNLSKPFWEGYLIHLITDKEIYDSKNGCIDMHKYCNDLKTDTTAREKLHRDWDITNHTLDEEFGIDLLPEIKALGKVKYVANEKAKYVNIKKLIEYIYKLREIFSDSEKIDIYINTIRK